MSTLQVANIYFESSGNNRIQYLGSNNYSFYAGGLPTLTVNTSTVLFTASMSFTSIGANTASANTLTANSFTVVNNYFVANGWVGLGNSTPIDKFYVQGNIVASGDVTTSYSDERLKTLLYKIERPLEKINSLNGWAYSPSALSLKLNPEQKNEIKLGVIAQEVESVLPEIVSIAPFDRNANGESVSGDKYLTVSYDRIVPVLI